MTGRDVFGACVSRHQRCTAFLRRLRADRRGVSILELALSLPIFLLLGLYGTEVAYMAMINMEVSQIATSVADNAARIGQTDNSAVTPTVTEDEIDSVMTGAMLQGGSFDFQDNGRIILSSLEQNNGGQQYIHWQRCAGDLAVSSAYGNQGSVKKDGMGASGHTVEAPSGMAVMYVEVYYQYQPLFGTMFVGKTQFASTAAMLIRDDRNLSPGVTGGSGDSNC